MAISMRYIDMHNHGYEFKEEVLLRFKNDYILVMVSEDLETSYITIDLSNKYSFIKPCIGIHPWNVEKASMNDLEKIIEIIEKENIECLGEIGLDKKFVAKTIDKQRMFFKKFLELAQEYDLLLNLHAAGTWREVLDLLIKYDINRAYFHWYTGPINLLDEIADKGYFIGANPAWKIQNKHKRILENVSLNIILTESDAPYRYRGLEMSPELIKDTIRFLAEENDMSVDKVKAIIYRNFLILYK